jgi:hypothetical protein
MVVGPGTVNITIGTEPMVEDNQRILAAALLWLRNHYEVGDPALRDDVIERIDRVLANYHPTVKDMKYFRKMFPRKIGDQPWN